MPKAPAIAKKVTTPATPATSSPMKKMVTLSNASTAAEVLTSIIGIMKSKVHIESSQMDRTVVFRVIGNGNLVTRDNGQIVNIYNTNATTPELMAKATELIQPDAFLALDLDSAKEDAKDILNSCSLSFSAGLDVVIQKNDEVKCKPTFYENRDGVQAVGLNFVGIQQAEVAKKGNVSALDALLAQIAE